MAATVWVNGAPTTEVYVPLNSVVSLLNGTLTGVLSQTWEILSYPEYEDLTQIDYGTNYAGWTLASGVLSLAQVTTFPAVTFRSDIPGSYLVRLSATTGSGTLRQTCVIRVRNALTGDVEPAAGENIESGAARGTGGWARLLNRWMRNVDIRKGRIRIYNGTGVTIAAKKAGKLSGLVDFRAVAGNTVPSGSATKPEKVPSVVVGNSNDADALTAKYVVLTEAIANDSFGWGVAWGQFEGDFSAFADGGTVYMNASGDLVAAPAGANAVILGYVLDNGTAGGIFFNGMGGGGGAAGAPATPQFMTLAADAGLANERVFTPGAGLSAVDGGAGAAYTLNIATAGVTRAMMVNGAATSILGRAGGTSGVLADIPATADGQFSVRRAGALTWATILDSDLPGTIMRTSAISIATGQVAVATATNTIGGSAALTFSGGNLRIDSGGGQGVVMRPDNVGVGWVFGNGFNRSYANFQWFNGIGSAQRMDLSDAGALLLANGSAGVGLGGWGGLRFHEGLNKLQWAQNGNTWFNLDAFALGTTQVIAGAGLSGGGPISSNVTLSLPSVGPGAITSGGNGIASITTDAQGRITAISSATYALASSISIAAGQVAVGTSTNVIGGSTNLTFDTSTRLLSFTNGRINGLTATFSSYTADGLFHANARPALTWSTPAGGSIVGHLGYDDGGGGQYQPAIGLTVSGVGRAAIRFRALGEANDKFTVINDGQLQWGPGGATAVDVTFGRNGAGELVARTGGVSPLTINPAAGVVSHFYLSEANQRWHIGRDAIGAGAAGLLFGPGGASTLVAAGAGVGLAGSQVLGLYASNGTVLGEIARAYSTSGRNVIGLTGGASNITFGAGTVGAPSASYNNYKIIAYDTGTPSGSYGIGVESGALWLNNGGVTKFYSGAVEDGRWGQGALSLANHASAGIASMGSFRYFATKAQVNENNTGWFDIVNSSRTVTAGSGLAGGGSLANNITISMPPTGPGAGVVGGTGIASITLDAQGRVTAIGTASYSTGGSGITISPGQMAFGNGSNTIGGNNNAWWDNVNARFGLGTTSPATRLHVVGEGRFANGNSSVSFVSDQITLAFPDSNYRHAIKSRHNGGAVSGNAIDLFLWTNVDAIGTTGTTKVATFENQALTLFGAVNTTLNFIPGSGGISHNYNSEAQPRYQVSRDAIAGGQSGILFGPGGASTFATSGAGIGWGGSGTLGFYISNGTVIEQSARFEYTSTRHRLGFFNPRSHISFGGSATGSSFGPPSSFDNWKIIIYDNASVPGTSYGLGIENNNLWFQSGVGYKFYMGGVNYVSMDNLGKTTFGSSIAPRYQVDVVGGSFSQIHFANGTADSGGYLLSTNAEQACFSGGVSYNGSAWIAKAGNASMMIAQAGAVYFYLNPGTTPGVAIAPVDAARFDVSSNRYRLVFSQGTSHVTFGTGTVGAPSTFDSWKIVAYDGGTPAGSYGFGIEGNHLWSHSGAGFKWYMGGVNYVTMDNTGRTVFGSSLTPRYQIDAINSTGTIAHFANSTADSGAYLVSTSDNQAILIGGGMWAGATWVARATVASGVFASNGQVSLQIATGLTVGAPMNPVAVSVFELASGRYRQSFPQATSHITFGAGTIFDPASYDGYKILAYDTGTASTSYGMGVESNHLWLNGGSLTTVGSSGIRLRTAGQACVNVENFIDTVGTKTCRRILFPISTSRVDFGAGSVFSPLSGYQGYKILAFDSGSSATSYGMGMEFDALFLASGQDFKFYGGGNRIALLTQSGGLRLHGSGGSGFNYGSSAGASLAMAPISTPPQGASMTTGVLVAYNSNGRFSYRDSNNVLYKGWGV